MLTVREFSPTRRLGFVFSLMEIRYPGTKNGVIGKTGVETVE
jgi:hypothetical protein